MIEAVHLSKFYGKTMAVEDIHFQIRPGEVIGLLGHNGSGKTTTMRMVTGCLKPSCGDVLISGKSLLTNPELKKQIGFLPEIPPLYQEMTVDEQMRFAAGLRGISGSAAQKSISLALRQLHVEEVRGRLIRNLSKGYRQRVGFAQALIGQPQFLVLDEPTVGLDPSQIIEVRHIISELAVSHTILLSSHILSEIAATCTRLIVLSSGRIAADDTPANLVDRVWTSRRWLLQADGNPDELLPLLQNITGIRNPVFDGTGYQFETEKDADVHIALFSALSESSHPIRQLSECAPDLEEVFLRLTHDDRYKEAL